MSHVTLKDFQWTPAKIIDCMQFVNCMGGHYAKYSFTGEKCSCGAKVNVLTGNPGWFCICGHYNSQSWSGAYNIPWENPTYGISRNQIRDIVDDYLGTGLFHYIKGIREAMIKGFKGLAL